MPTPISFEDFLASLPLATSLDGGDLIPGETAGGAAKFTSDMIAQRAINGGFAPRLIHAHDLSGIQKWVSDLLGRYEWTRASYVITNARPTYYLSSDDCFGTIRSSATTGYIYCEGLDYNTWTMLDIAQGTTTHLYVGPVADAAGESWAGTASAKKLTLSGGSLYLVLRGQGTWYCVQFPAFTSTSTAVFPTFEGMDVLIGQSWAVILQQVAQSAVRRWRNSRGLANNRFLPANTAFGSSSILEGGAVAGNNWRIQSTNSAGPRYTQSLAAINAAIAANPGVLVRNITLIIGANEFPVVTDLAAMSTLTTQITNMLTDLKTALNSHNPNVKIYIVPLCNVDSIGAAVNDGAYYAVRRAFLNAVNPAANIFRGAEFSGYSRPYGEIHHNTPVMAAFAQELAQLWARYDEGLNYSINPRIMGSVTRMAAGHFRINIDRYGGVGTGLSNVSQLNKPPLPIGFAIHTTNDYFANNVLIPYAFNWAGLSGGLERLDLFVNGDTLTPELAYPYGSFYQASTQKDQLIYVDDVTTGVRHYLGAYHPSN